VSLGRAGVATLHGDKRTAIPPAGFWPLFCFSLVGLGLIWLPMAVLQQVDAALTFATPYALVSDTALLLLVLCVLSVPLAAFAAAVGWTLSHLGAGIGAGRAAAWCLVGLPVACLCTWQFVFCAKLWLEQVLHIRLTTGTLPHRELLALIPVLAAIVLWLVFGTARLLHAATEPVLRLKTPALWLTFLAAVLIVWQRPAIGMRPGDLATRPPAASGLPDVFVFSLDALAAEDAALCSGNSTTMPRLQSLAARSTCFTHHYAASNRTFPSTTTLETGALPWTHWVVQSGPPSLDPAHASIAQALQAAGYETHAIVAAQGASPREHGTQSGYDSAETAASRSWQMTLLNTLQVFPDARSLPGLLSGTWSLLGLIDLTHIGAEGPNPPENVYKLARRLIDRQHTGRPLYLWMHTWPPHSPYLPPPSTKYRLLPPGQLQSARDFLADVADYDASKQPAIDRQRLRYRETIMGADEKLGDFLDQLDRQGRLDTALIVVTADHGESFERGVLGHGGDALHEAVIRIPLIVKLPHQRSGRVVETPTSQADVAPTLSDLITGRTLPAAEGRSLRAALHGEMLPVAPVFSMAINRESRYRPLRGGHHVVVEGRQKLNCHLAANRCELYDLSTDPYERVDLAATHADEVARLRALLTRRLAAAEQNRNRWFGSR
jgi:arylsulfatase A-like enzyme